MVRSMYSGVSGLRAHQTRMDTIGNNIANVNTYGFKSSRTTFRDIYYQTMSAASGPTAALGGMNPSAVGYGSKLGSVDLMMGRSTFTMTDQTMDIAVDGDGFFQVMDGAGNTYYTRAGMLNFDATGNLVDMQGNFVLGINGDPSGRNPGSEKIRVALPPVSPTPSSVSQTVNGVEYTISASTATADGNINFNFTTDASLADGTVQASISSNGIIIKFNPDNQYSSWAEINSAVNEAIYKANGNKAHPAGEFNIAVTSGTDPFSGGATLSAAEITSTDYGIKLGEATFAGRSFFGGITTTGKVGTSFAGTGPMNNLSCTYLGGNPAHWEVSMQVGADTYKGIIDETKTATGKFNLQKVGGDANDYIEMSRPSFNTLVDKWNSDYGTAGAKAQYKIDFSGGAVAAGTTVDFDGLSPLTLTGSDPLGQATQIASYINTNSSDFTAVVDGSGNVVVTSKTAALAASTPTFNSSSVALAGAYSTVSPGVDPVVVLPGDAFPVQTAAMLGNPIASPSTPSHSLGFSGTAFALRGGTLGGEQTIADMTGISIAPNGMILGYDSQGLEILIGRIDIATFANPAGLAQAGSSNYTATANSGEAKLSQPGTAGAGKLVGGSLELSNVDLSREFSDMITTQRGYQANSRIITVSDTMLEELINLKR